MRTFPTDTDEGARVIDHESSVMRHRYQGRRIPRLRKISTPCGVGEGKELVKLVVCIEYTFAPEVVDRLDRSQTSAAYLLFERNAALSLDDWLFDVLGFACHRISAAQSGTAAATPPSVFATPMGQVIPFGPMLQ
jgi:hypothetical protein